MAGAPEVLIRRLQTVGEARACAQAMADSEPWRTLRRSFDDNLKLLQDPAKEVYVAISDSALAGFLVLHLHGPLNGYLQTIGVMPHTRSSGIGQKLILFAEERIFRESPNVFLCVSSFNTGARRLYERLGYTQVGEFKDYIVQGRSELLMRKTRGPIAEFTPLQKPPG